MSVVLPEVAAAVLRDELRAAGTWLSRHPNWKVEVGDDGLSITATISHATLDTFWLRGVFDGYRALAPAWEFLSAAGEPGLKSAWPKPTALPEGGASIFHSNPCICAPFNRLAYKSLGGPHADWGAPSNWLSVPAKLVMAPKLGNMLQVIDTHLSLSTGRMA